MRRRAAPILVGLVLTLGAPHAVRADTPAPVTYTVRSGDSLSRIGAKFGVSVADLQRVNGMGNKTVIQIGQRLKIPVANGALPDAGLPPGSVVLPSHSLPATSGSPAPIALTVPASSAAPAPIVHIVKSGDSLSKIASRYGSTVLLIRSANGLSGDTIVVGQRLEVPNAASAQSIDQRTYVRHPAMNVSAAEVEVLARIVKGECPEDTPWLGKVAVAAVVLNRVRASWWPNTITRVAHQPLQFSCYNPEFRNRLYKGTIPDFAWAAARAALQGHDPTGGATHYYNPFLVRPAWAKRLEFVVRYGDDQYTAHDFYRPRGDSPVPDGVPSETGFVQLLAQAGSH